MKIFKLNLNSNMNIVSKDDDFHVFEYPDERCHRRPEPQNKTAAGRTRRRF